jgi:hypothetical protein
LVVAHPTAINAAATVANSILVCVFIFYVVLWPNEKS